ncbi:hypothetical protein GLOTRDRAFT_120772 [Gloeophyllum trabeum ATCC 11539]|uniref:F-box domain-containing protein n=1 Tax=Gloeophyllum trabeum (strain ATCC 11539 / FP-39264 / Madison 617) TaxID=670483 RepID=S7Q9W6_GLOTA|nr:uncharacterized protein GLOTRDRAFT_120772 [Gloeophyllum trabeum ATCC 11539]EPQ56138.1 hypothetical protein GLOTRDRAFT_120772 [Gloeophyllum trabeum ATCC 11539]
MQLDYEDGHETELSFPTLPIDILLHILSYLSVKDVISLRKTSKHLQSLTRLHAVWLNVLLAEVLPMNIPMPGLYSRDISSLSASDLEAMISRALRLRKNWLSQHPETRKRLEIVPLPEEEKRDTLRSAVVRFLPGRCNRYLLTVTGHTNFSRRRYTVQCWDLEADSGPKCVAVRRFTEIVSVAVNCDPTAPGVLSVTCKVEGDAAAHPSTFIHALDLGPTNDNPEYAFKYINHFPGCRRLHIFRGSLLVGTNESEAVRVWDVNTGKVIFELQDPTTHQPGVCVSAVFLEDTRFLVLFRTVSLEIYLLPPCPTSAPPAPPSPTSPNTDFQVLHPVAMYRWQWRIDSVSVSFQMDARKRYGKQLNTPSTCSSSQKSKTNENGHPYEPTPMHLFMRFDSWFPWPVNLLHHFVLYPNPSYAPSLPPSASPVFSDHPPSHLNMNQPNLPTSHALSTSSFNPLTDLPYLATPDQTPTLVSSISSNVRLFAPSDMVLGEWGTALWLDTQTEAWGVSSELGQRIAGRVVVTSGFDERKAYPAQGSEGESVNTTTAAAEPALGAAFAAATRQVPPAQTASMTFGIRDTSVGRKMGEGGVPSAGGRGGADEWTNLALDEEGGRVIVGRSGGRVEVWEYV